MPKHVFLFSGSSAVGKTSILRYLIPFLEKGGMRTAICKIDCLSSNDESVYKSLNIPTVTGLSRDICPDHFLVSNLPELWDWCDCLGRDCLLIETAGLCHRCSPATELCTAGCVLDCTASSHSPERLGPMVSGADFIILTKIDMVSQAELEIIEWQLKKLNPGARIFPADGLAGYGTEFLGSWLLERPEIESLKEDRLRHTMPAGVCSYCVGEQRVGSAYQQGVVGKIFQGGIRR